MNNRGSEWRKWDLHIHTPASFYWTGTKKYKEMSTEEITAEIKNFIKIINESDIAVFCLMDYWTFDWYLELQDYLIANPDELKKTVFPGMELRVESPTSYRLNIHFILSDKLSRQQLIDFKSELYIRSIGKKLSDDALIQFAKSLDASKAKHHSFADPKTLTEDQLLLLGSTTAEITKESLHAAFKQIPYASGFVFLPYDTSDGLLKLDWKKHPHADNYFMQTADIFESRDQCNIDLISGKLTEENEPFFENFFKTLGNKAKPCVAGSDAHKYSDYGNFPSKKATWIKADTTFEGFKQIIFEPEQRVKIQESEPDFKDEKLIIDEVKFLDTNGKFTPLSIKFNKNLNVIIGGKSSGKSILLYNIARTLLADKEFLKKENLQDKYGFRLDNPKFNFEVKSLGGFEQLMYRPENENSIIPEIKYIPQNYLVKLAEPEINKKGEVLLKLIRNLIKEEPESYDIYESFLEKVKSNDKKRESMIDNYFFLRDKIIELQNELKLKNKKEILEQNIKTNSEKISELNKSIGLNEEQIKSYNNLQLNLEEINAKITKVSNDYKKVFNFQNDAFTILEDLRSKKDLILNSLEVDEIKTIFIENFKPLDSFLETLKQTLNSYSLEKTEDGKTRFKEENVFKDLIFSNRDKKSLIEKQIEPYLKNEEVKKVIKTIEETINEDKKNLGAILQLSKEIEEYKKALTQEKEDLFKLYEENITEYPNVIEKLKDRVVELTKDNLIIEGIVKFNFPKFKQSMLSISNGTSGSYKPFKMISDDNSAIDEYNNDELLDTLNKVFELIVNGEYVLLKDVSRKDALKRLLNDYFFDYWEVKYLGDKLGEMSAGKASFVILMLIVGLSRSKAPLLIDQPEDNLDNRSITNDLVTYLRSKKLERQIILVSHNPNIVVNADAENVIVANQEGQIANQTTSPYKFDYTNGALENTFLKNETEKNLLQSMGIREHIADIVEGGKEAFKKRERKYGFS